MNKVFSYQDAKQVIISGDIHGAFETLVYKLCISYQCKDTLLIVAGDCGFGFDKPGFYDQVYNKLADRLRKANNWVVFVRGNHDDPSYFFDEKICHKRWRTIPDYSVVQACGHNILCVGGAVSIDRGMRMDENARKMSMGHKLTAVWWIDEAPVFNKLAIESLPPIDTVVTHTAPSFCELNSKQGLQSWAKNDPMLLHDVAEEQKTIDKIHKQLITNGHPVKEWYYGHFHQTWSALIDGIHYYMLDITEFREVDSFKEE